SMRPLARSRTDEFVVRKPESVGSVFLLQVLELVNELSRISRAPRSTIELADVAERTTGVTASARTDLRWPGVASALNIPERVTCGIRQRVEVVPWNTGQIGNDLASLVAKRQAR